MVDHQFADPELAALYDRFCSWDGRDDLDFYLPLVMAAGSVLDVGCGTGMLLHRARENGHPGRLVGLDPAGAMLDVARARDDIEWVQGELSSVSFDREFELIVMTGHAFQVLTSDAQLTEALAAVTAALTRRGRFAFETRNPMVSTWELWTPDHVVEIAGPAGQSFRQSHQVELPVTGELVSFTSTFTSAGWRQPRVSRSTLRFLSADALLAFLSAAGLTVAEQYGDWGRQPLDDRSPEIITIAMPMMVRSGQCAG